MYSSKPTVWSAGLRCLLIAAGIAVGGCPSSDTGDDSSDAGDGDAFDVAPDAGGEDSGLIDLGLDAGPPIEVCDSEGATRTAPCGNCGSRSEVCEEGSWAVNSDCIGEGVCAPGQVEEETNDRCLDRARLCGDSCEWGAWDVTSEEGECVPDSTRQLFEGCDYPGDFQTQTCSEVCEWELSDSLCRSECPDLDRTGLDAEICIPSADAVMQAAPDSTATATASVSRFVIDRYDVTVGAYASCVDDGACPAGAVVARTEPILNGLCGLDACADDPPESGVLVHRSGAVAYCNWVGKRLPSLAEWTLAGRGEAPRAPDYPWWNGVTGAGSNDHYGCDTVPSRTANSGCSDAIPRVHHSVDQHPATSSVFGAVGLIGTYYDGQWFLDRYVAEESDFLTVYAGTDPVASSSDGPCWTAFVGGYHLPSRTLVTRSRLCDGDEEVASLEFRCVREVP